MNTMTDTPARIRVKIATDEELQNNLVRRSQQKQDLADLLSLFLSNKGIDVRGYSLVALTQRELEERDYQWLILVLSSDKNATNPSIKIPIDRARELVAQRHLQGMTVITDSPSPGAIAAQWPTLRIFDVDAQKEKDMDDVFNKISTTLGHVTPLISINTRGGQSAGRLTQDTAGFQLSPRMVVISILAIIVLFVSGFFGIPVLSHFLSPSPTHISSATLPPGHSLTQPSFSTPTTGNPTVTSTPDPANLLRTLPKNPTVYALTISDTQSTNDWQNGSSFPSCIFTPSGYNISSSTSGEYIPCMRQSKTYQNFAFQVQMNIHTNGDAGGLIFRANSQMSVFYRFSVDTVGAYKLFLCTHCASNANVNANELKEGTVQANNQYTLTVIAIQNTIYLYIDNRFVDLATDSTSPSGSIGLYAADLTNQPASVEFTNAKIWKL